MAQSLALGALVTYPDGYAGAPATPAQFPGMLSGYAKRPPWHVAGVDYGVGPPANQVYKTPGVDAMPSGASYNSGTHNITVSAANVVLDGWDMTVSGGIQVVGSGACSNITISNCKFLVGANTNPFTNMTSACSGGTIINNIFDGAGTNNLLGVGLLYIAAGGNWIVRYNLFQNAFSDFIDFLAGVTGSITVQYNLFRNNGLGTGTGAHPDLLQSAGAGPMYLDISFNTFQIDNSIIGTQGCSCTDGSVTTVCSGANYSNNTWVLTAPLTGAGVAECYIVDRSQLVDRATIQGNYVDPTAINTSFLRNLNSGFGPYSGTVVESGNVNMVSGGSIS